MSRWNPYYVAFALAHGRVPEEMLRVEREVWPGGAMAGFLAWMSRRWREWGRLRGLRRDGGGSWYDAAGRHVLLSDLDHAAFGGWLLGRSTRVALELDGPRSSQVVHAPSCSIDRAVIERGGQRRYPCVCDCGAEDRA